MKQDLLNETEKRVFTRLKKGQVEMPELVKMLGSNRKSVAVRMKYLAAKLAPEGFVIENVNTLGRGKHAIYKMEKKF